MQHVEKANSGRFGRGFGFFWLLFFAVKVILWLKTTSPGAMFTSGPRSRKMQGWSQQQSSTFLNRVPSTATSQNQGLMFALQHWLSSMTTQVLVCQLFASYSLQTCSPSFCIAWSSEVLVSSGIKLQCRSWPGLDRVPGLRAAHTWKWPWWSPEGSHWPQELLESAAPCRSPSLALFPVPAQWVTVATRVTGPYCLGKWKSYSGENWHMNFRCTSCLARMAQEHAVMWQSSSPFHCFLKDFKEVTWEWAACTEQLTPCLFTSCFPFLRKNYFYVIKDKTSSYISSNYGRSLLILEKIRAFIISPSEMKVRVNYLWQRSHYCLDPSQEHLAALCDVDFLFQISLFYSSFSLIFSY